MNTRMLITSIVVALIVLGGYFFFSMRAAAPTDTAEETNTENVQNETREDAPFAAIVTYTDGGFSPSDTPVRVGETVRFVNNAGSGMWVGADEHPTHTSYDGTTTRDHCVDGAAIGGTFDMCRQAAPGESWEFTFTKAGTFPYHNHARAAHGGTITVTE